MRTSARRRVIAVSQSRLWAIKQPAVNSKERINNNRVTGTSRAGSSNGRSTAAKRRPTTKVRQQQQQGAEQPAAPSQRAGKGPSGWPRQQALRQPRASSKPTTARRCQERSASGGPQNGPGKQAAAKDQTAEIRCWRAANRPTSNPAGSSQAISLPADRSRGKQAGGGQQPDAQQSSNGRREKPDQKQAGDSQARQPSGGAALRRPEGGRLREVGPIS